MSSSLQQQPPQQRKEKDHTSASLLSPCARDNLIFGSIALGLIVFIIAISFAFRRKQGYSRQYQQFIRDTVRDASFHRAAGEQSRSPAIALTESTQAATRIAVIRMLASEEDIAQMTRMKNFGEFAERVKFQQSEAIKQVHDKLRNC